MIKGSKQYRPAGGGAAGQWKHLEFPAGGDQRMKFKFGLEKMQTGMRNMIIVHIFETTLRFEGEKKAGLGLRRRILQAFPLPRSAPSGWFMRVLAFTEHSWYSIFIL
jgi:hypothetical protein